MDKTKINFIDDDNAKVWNDRFNKYVDYKVTFRRDGFVRLLNTNNGVSGTYFFCEDTKRKSPAIFMLKDKIWNKITPDFELCNITNTHRGLLSLEAADKRACEYLGRHLNKDDFRLDDYRNDALLYVFNVLK